MKDMTIYKAENKVEAVLDQVLPVGDPRAVNSASSTIRTAFARVQRDIAWLTAKYPTLWDYAVPPGADDKPKRTGEVVIVRDTNSNLSYEASIYRLYISGLWCDQRIALVNANPPTRKWDRREFNTSEIGLRQIPSAYGTIPPIITGIHAYGSTDTINSFPIYRDLTVPRVCISTKTIQNPVFQWVIEPPQDWIDNGIPENADMRLCNCVPIDVTHPPNDISVDKTYGYIIFDYDSNTDKLYWEAPVDLFGEGNPTVLSDSFFTDLMISIEFIGAL